ncbi:probable outer membrane secretion protein -Rhodobacter capsulatus, partial [hydrothermal vent metagenome]
DIWNQQAYLKASNTDAGDQFGAGVSLSGDGTTLAVGAWGEASNDTGIDGNEANNDESFSGAVYLFTFSGGLWTQQGYLKANNAEANDLFGFVVGLNTDGNTLAVGAIGESSSSNGVGGNPVSNGAINSGAVYVFTRSAGIWDQQAYIKASNTGMNDQFGFALNLSSDGNTLAVGAYSEGSNAIGVGGDSLDNSAANSGAVYVFTRSSGLWDQQAYIKASNTQAGDRFGFALSLSADGTTLAVGADLEDSNGINGDQTNNSRVDSGAVYLY